MISFPQPPAEELEKQVKLAAAGDRQAFGVVYDMFYERVYAYVYRRLYNQQVAEDIVSSSFMAAYEHIGPYTWHDEARWYAWLFQIVRNQMSSYYKNTSRSGFIEDWEAFESKTPSGNAPIVEAYAKDSDAKLLHDAVSLLPQKYRDPVELYYFAGLSHAVIAESLGIREGAARVRLHRALEMLTNSMKGQGYEYRG